MLSLTVILPTYNAITYLEEMLDSLRLQTRQPDEVRIFDDCSTDDTVEMIEKYIARYNLHNWFLYRNEKNKGWIKNFMDAAHSVKDSDVILFADQDDIWHRSKLEIIEETMTNHTEISVLAHGRKNFKNREFDLEKVVNIPIIQYNDTKLTKYKVHGCSFRTYGYPGCSLAVRRIFVEKVFNYWFESCAYDLFYCATSVIFGGLWIYSDELVYQRIHYHNTTGRGSDSHNFAYQFSTLNDENKFLDMLYRLAMNEKSNMLEKVTRAKKFSTARQSWYENKKFINAIRLAGYLDCYPHVRSYMQDVILVLAEKLKLGGLLENVQRLWR